MDLIIGLKKVLSVKQLIMLRIQENGGFERWENIRIMQWL